MLSPKRHVLISLLSFYFEIINHLTQATPCTKGPLCRGMTFALSTITCRSRQDSEGGELSTPKPNIKTAPFATSAHIQPSRHNVHPYITWTGVFHVVRVEVCISGACVLLKLI